jgi:hypothetical protein
MNFAMSVAVEATGRCGKYKLVLFRGLARDPISLAGQGEQLRRQRLPEARMGHAERLEQVFFNVAIEALTRDALHDIARQRGGVVRVSRC